MDTFNDTKGNYIEYLEKEIVLHLKRENIDKYSGYKAVADDLMEADFQRVIADVRAQAAVRAKAEAESRLVITPDQVVLYINRNSSQGLREEIDALLTKETVEIKEGSCFTHEHIKL
jgi:hypothetical protein